MILQRSSRRKKTWTGSRATGPPSKSSRLGSLLANLSNAHADELYVFKLSQGPGAAASGVKKNGTHYSDNSNSPYNIGGVTKGGEVVRLFADDQRGQQRSAGAGTGGGGADVYGVGDARMR